MRHESLERGRDSAAATGKSVVRKCPLLTMVPLMTVSDFVAIQVLRTYLRERENLVAAASTCIARRALRLKNAELMGLRFVALFPPVRRTTAKSLYLGGFQ